MRPRAWSGVEAPGGGRGQAGLAVPGCAMAGL